MTADRFSRLPARVLPTGSEQPSEPQPFTPDIPPVNPLTPAGEIAGFSAFADGMASGHTTAARRRWGRVVGWVVVAALAVSVLSWVSTIFSL